MTPWEFREGDTFKNKIGLSRKVIIKDGRLGVEGRDGYFYCYLDAPVAGYASSADYFRDTASNFAHLTDCLTTISTEDLEAELAKRKAEEASHIVECWVKSPAGNQHRELVDDRKDDFAKTIVPFMQHFEKMGFKIDVHIYGNSTTWFYKRQQ